ncbi:hypothetical protein [Halorubrum vacuolatum]|uniref:Uncharacterized protein n=1 Tax=Halorubrum vacuolatum TaxID=63740 RepID=A0A238X268_HALVU|nr:hypothetical protein [Halorubrum vacuolatum]SNR52534.1 hypothetical protein SAMN06264855_11241 [Halorubrum vacuolatum]
MMALVDFLVRLVGDVGRFVEIFVNEVILGAGDPLSIVSLAIGQVLIGFAVLVLAYGVVGALFSELGVQLPTLGRGRGE